MQSSGHGRQDYSHTQVRHMSTSRDNVLTSNNGESKLPGLPLAKSHVSSERNLKKGGGR